MKGSTTEILIPEQHQFQHWSWSTRTCSTAWPVPYACAQQYHRGGGTINNCFALVGPHQHGITVEPMNNKAVYQRSFTTEASARARALQTAELLCVLQCWNWYYSDSLAWGICAKTMKSHWPNNKNLEQEFSGQKKMKFVFISRSQFANPNIPFPS